MQRRPDPLLAIINAARHVAAERIARAARGELPRLPQLLAAVALEATHAYVTLYGEAPPPVKDMGVIRNAQPPNAPERMIDYAMYVQPCEHGPN